MPSTYLKKKCTECRKMALMEYLVKDCNVPNIFGHYTLPTIWSAKM